MSYYADQHIQPDLATPWHLNTRYYICLVTYYSFPNPMLCSNTLSCTPMAAYSVPWLHNCRTTEPTSAPLKPTLRRLHRATPQGQQWMGATQNAHPPDKALAASESEHMLLQLCPSLSQRMSRSRRRLGDPGTAWRTSSACWPPCLSHPAPMMPVPHDTYSGTPGRAPCTPRCRALLLRLCCRPRARWGAPPPPPDDGTCASAHQHAHKQHTCKQL
jgi:hypothetical protein